MRENGKNFSRSAPTGNLPNKINNILRGGLPSLRGGFQGKSRCTDKLKEIEEEFYPSLLFFFRF